MASKYCFEGSSSSKEMAKFFTEHGCLVVRMYDFEKNRDHQIHREEFAQSRRDAPELNAEHAGSTDKLVVGAFGGDGIPSTFHSLPARTTRAHAHVLLAPMLADTVKRDGSWYVQGLFDRSRFEISGTKIGGESWHRDSCSIKTKYDKRLTGGWVNMSKERVQKFSFLKGTHNDLPTGKGFDKCKDLEDDFVAKNKVVLLVPPGFAVIFYQELIHEISKGKVEGDSLRLHLGFCVAQSKESLFKMQHTWMMEQGVPRIPSNQIPPMHSANHASFPKLRATLPTFAERFNPLCVKEVTIKSGKSVGEKYKTVGWGPGRSFGYSLKDLEELPDSGIKRYRAYTTEEQKVMMPTNTRRIKSRELDASKRQRAPKEAREPKQKKAKSSVEPPPLTNQKKRVKAH